jgi:hypothetical protein
MSRTQIQLTHTDAGVIVLSSDDDDVQTSTRIIPYSSQFTRVRNMLDECTQLVDDIDALTTPSRLALSPKRRANDDDDSDDDVQYLFTIVKKNKKSPSQLSDSDVIVLSDNISTSEASESEDDDNDVDDDGLTYDQRVENYINYCQELNEIFSDITRVEHNSARWRERHNLPPFTPNPALDNNDNDADDEGE